MPKSRLARKIGAGDGPGFNVVGFQILLEPASILIYQNREGKACMFGIWGFRKNLETCLGYQPAPVLVVGPPLCHPVRKAFKLAETKSRLKLGGAQIVARRDKKKAWINLSMLFFQLGPITALSYPAMGAKRAQGVSQFLVIGYHHSAFNSGNVM
jgi:hypothetical protein